MEEDTGTNKFLVVIIIFVAATILFLLWMTSTADAEELKEQQCRESIRIHSLLVRTSGQDADPDIRCEPRTTTISGNTETMQRAVAEEFLFCWQRWQEGEAELFAEEGTYCNPCSIITFTGEKRTVTGIEEFMATHTPAKSEVTYKELLFPYASAEYPLEVRDDWPAMQLFTDKTYAVVFYNDKNHSIKSLLEAAKEDPAKVTNAIQDTLSGMGTGAKWGVGIAVTGGIICTVISGGICGGVIAAVAGTGIVAGVGAGIGGGVAVHNGFEYPEWFSNVLIIPNNETVYQQLGCGMIHQQGPTERTNGAENI